MSTDDEKGELPESPVPGLIPTLNNTGWMTESLDDFSTAFTEYAGQINEESLDIGCAYGIATLAAVERGARVLACDLEPKHLEILAARVPAKRRSQVRTQAGALPDVEFPQASFGAILAARVLHFLTGDDIDTTVQKMREWLVPGGRVFLIADSPYTGPWQSAAPDYERRKAAGERWPGFFADYASLLPPGTDAAEHPRFINPQDPDLLSRSCEEAGLRVLEARFLRGGTRRASDRDHAGVIATKD